MIGASKILTVSYGTFSCTLEGFDEPFNTMKAIAEYFRDLAAEDRYFGAEPPTPDAAMLHKIAEREIQRRVEAKIQDNGVILRAGESEAKPSAAEPARLAPTVSESPTLDANGDSAAARLSRLRASQNAVEAPAVNQPQPEPAALAAAPIAAAAMTAEEVYDDDYSEDQHAGAMNASVLDAIAARAAAPVAPAEVSPAESEDLYITDDSGFDDFTQAEEVDTLRATDTEATDLPQDAPETEDFGDLSGTLADLIDEDAVATADPDVAISSEVEHAEHDLAPLDEPAHEIAASAEMLLAETSEDEADEAALEDAVGYFDPKNSDQLIEDDDQQDEIEDSDDTAQMLASIASLTAEAPEDADAGDKAEPGAEDYAEEAAHLLQHSEASDPDADLSLAEPEPEAAAPPAQSATLSAEEALAEALGIDAPQARAMIEDDALAPVEDEPEVQPQRARARVIKVRRIQPAVASEPAAPATASLLSAESEAALQAELAALQDDNDQVGPVTSQAAPQTVRPTRPVRPVRPALTPSVEAEDADTAFSDAIKGVMAETEAEPQVAPHDSRHLLTEIAEDEAVNRLMAQTNSAMDGPEARRRSMAISHLKAAVAATEADRQVLAANPGKPQPDRQDIYRSDLNSVVRVKPGEAARNGSDRPSPLVLVSEQRIDRIKPNDTAPAPRVVTPTRPARVAAAAFSAQDTLIGNDFDDDDDSLSAEEASANLFAAGQSFADFAEQLGAESLHDLLEAAAVYCAQVLGRPQFSRPMVMSQISSLPQGENHKLEEQLRAFGTLMREGRITKVKRGAFAVTDRSPLLAEALRNVG
jgi:hypothetical protein